MPSEPVDSVSPRKRSRLVSPPARFADPRSHSRAGGRSFLRLVAEHTVGDPFLVGFVLVAVFLWFIVG